MQPLRGRLPWPCYQHSLLHWIVQKPFLRWGCVGKRHELQTTFFHRSCWPGLAPGAQFTF